MLKPSKEERPELAPTLHGLIPEVFHKPKRAISSALNHNERRGIARNGLHDSAEQLLWIRVKVRF
jgi:hypothetical protein